MGWLDSALRTAGEKWIAERLKPTGMTAEQFVQEVKDWVQMKPALIELLAAHEAQPHTEPTDPPPPAPVPNPTAGDVLDLSRVEWLGAKVAASVPVTAHLVSAQIDGGMLVTAYDAYQWPSNNAANKPCDAICHLFYERGDRIVGGKFDYWKNGGQSRKTLGNVSSGYQGHAMPTRGTRVWTMISSLDGKQRSNTCAVTWA